MTRRPLPRPAIVSAIVAALTLACIAATAGFLLGRYELLPRALPIHFRGGRADRYMMKNVAVVFAPLWTQMILVAVIGGVSSLLIWRAHRLAPADGQAVQDRDRMLHAAEAAALLGFVWVFVQMLSAWGVTELWLNGRGGMGFIYNYGMITAIVASIVVLGRAAMRVGRLQKARAVWDERLHVSRPVAIAIVIAILLAGLGGPFLLARALLR